MRFAVYEIKFEFAPHSMDLCQLCINIALDGLKISSLAHAGWHHEALQSRPLVCNIRSTNLKRFEFENT